MNTVIFMGRLTKDPDVRTTQSGTQVASFSLAVDRRFKTDGGPSADFFNCAAFGKLAEFVEKYLKKGTKILLKGRIENNNYTDRQGVKRYDFRVTAESIEFCEKRGEEEPKPEPKPEPQTDEDGFMSGYDEELPFN